MISGPRSTSRKASGKASRKAGKRAKRKARRWFCNDSYSRRIGPLPPEVLARIAAASEEDINQWVDRILDADCLEGVFRP